MTAWASSLNGISADMEVISPPRKWTFPCSKKGCYRIFPVDDPEARERAQELMKTVYQERGYLNKNDEASHNFLPSKKRSVFTLLAEDEQGESAGTVSLHLDSSVGLPCDEIFGEEAAALRVQGQKLVEVTGLAVSARHTRSKALLVHLMNFILIAARRVFQSNKLVIEVNPRHENFYRRLLKFEEAGPVRSCRRVCGVPARLLSLDMELQKKAVRMEAGGASAVRPGKSRSLYSHFKTLKEEEAIARFLKHSDGGEHAKQETWQFPPLEKGG